MALEVLDEEDQASDDGGMMMSPLQMMMGMQMVTPEGKAKAAEVFNDLYGKRSQVDTEEQAAYDEYETRAQEAREVLKRAREVLAAKKTPSTKWLDMAAGYGSPTRTGSFGESMSNYAKLRREGRHDETQWEADRDKQVLAFDQGMGAVDQGLALQRLKLRQLKKAADDKLMIESMKIMGKPAPAGKTPPKTPETLSAEQLNRQYIPQYLEWTQTGRPNYKHKLASLERSGDTLAGRTRIKAGQKLPDGATAQQDVIYQGRPSDFISGRFINLLPQWSRLLMGMSKSVEIQQDVESTIQDTMKDIMGSAFTQREGIDMLARAYNPGFEEELNARRVGFIQSRLMEIAEEKERAARWYETNNGNMQGYEGRTSWGASDLSIPSELGGDSGDPEMVVELWKKFGQGRITGDAAPRLQGDTPPAAAPKKGERVQMEWFVPAKAHGGRVRIQYAKGGLVETTGDGRNVWLMDDGVEFEAPAEVSYDDAKRFYLQNVKQVNVPTRPGLPAQEIPNPEDAEPTPFEAGAVPSPLLQGAAEEEPTVIDVSDASVMERALENAPEAIGATGAGAVGALTANRVLPHVGDKLLRRAPSNAQKRVMGLMNERRQDPQALIADVKRTQGMGVPAMMMDTAPHLRMLAEDAMSRSGGDEATEALRRVQSRVDQLPERTMDQVNQALAPDEFFDQEDKLRNNLYTNAKPLYQQAYAAHPAVQSPALYEILKTPDGKKAVKKAWRIMTNEGKQIGKADKANMVRNPSLEFLDHVKRGLDDLINKEEGVGPNRQVTELGKSLRTMRTRFRDELDTATSGEYKAARAQYAGDLEVLDALHFGRDDFLKMQPQELDKRVAKMSWAEKDALRTGVAQKLFETIEAPTGETNSARKVIGSAATRKKLRTLFDTDKQYRVFETALTRDMELYDASRATAAAGERGQRGTMTVEKPSILEKAGAWVPRLGIGSATMWTLQAARNLKVASDKEIEEVIKLLKSATQDELAHFDKKITAPLKRGQARVGRRGKVATAGALMGAGEYVRRELRDEE